MDVEKHNSEHELEQWMDAEFKRMPLIKAPSGLSDKIMSAIVRRSELPWWKRPYNQWNIFHRIGFILASATALIVCLWLSFTYSSSIPAETSIISLSNFPSLVKIILNLTLSLADSILLVIGAYKFWFLAIAACIVILYALCIAIGTAGIALAIKSSKERQNENYS